MGEGGGGRKKPRVEEEKGKRDHGKVRRGRETMGGGERDQEWRRRRGKETGEGVRRERKRPWEGGGHERKRPEEGGEGGERDQERRRG